MFGNTKPGYAASERASDLARERAIMIGPAMNFAATEAYKVLRTNLLFSFTEDIKCPAIGITSSIRGEGKSLTSINTAYTIAQAGKSVLLIEGDMRIPVIAKRLRLRAKPGLSNLLVGMNSIEETIQRYSSGVNTETKTVFDVIVAGDTPPNPSELLGSAQMKSLIETVKRHYDTVIVDLPPVTAVTDTLVVSKIVDGVVLVVRHGYAERGAITDAMRQLNFVNARVLGFVYNGVSEVGPGYGARRGYYRRGGYYRRNGYYRNSNYYKTSDGDTRSSDRKGKWNG